MQAQSLSQEDALEKEMATRCSILAWKVSCIEEPGRLQSMGLQRVRHDLACLHVPILQMWKKRPGEVRWPVHSRLHAGQDLRPYVSFSRPSHLPAGWIHHRPAGGHTGMGIGGKGRDFRLRQTPLESWLCHHWLSGLGQVVYAPQASIHWGPPQCIVHLLPALFQGFCGIPHLCTWPSAPSTAPVPLSGSCY